MTRQRYTSDLIESHEASRKLTESGRSSKTDYTDNNTAHVAYYYWHYRCPQPGTWKSELVIQGSCPSRVSLSSFLNWGNYSACMALLISLERESIKASYVLLAVWLQCDFIITGDKDIIKLEFSFWQAHRKEEGKKKKKKSYLWCSALANIPRIILVCRRGTKWMGVFS